MVIQNKKEVEQSAQSLFQESRFRIRNETANLTLAVEGIKKESYQYCKTKQQIIGQLVLNMTKDVLAQLKQVRVLVESTEHNLHNLSPRNVLKRGYSITQRQGRVIRSFDQVKEGDLLDTVLYEGRVSSQVRSTTQSTSNDE